MSFSALLHALRLPEAAILASTALCPKPEAPPVVEVLFRPEPTGYSEAHDAKYLMTAPRLNDAGKAHKGAPGSWVKLGVTDSRIRTQVGINGNMLTFPQSGKKCYYLEKVTYEIVYTPFVYVASDIRDLKCTYDRVRAHEQEHVAINYRSLKSHLPQVKKGMEAYIARFAHRPFGPFAPERMESNRQMILEQLRAAGQPFVDQMEAGRRRRQDSIDTDESYRRDAEKCPQDRAEISKRFFERK